VIPPTELLRSASHLGLSGVISRLWRTAPERKGQGEQAERKAARRQLLLGGPVIKVALKCYRRADLAKSPSPKHLYVAVRAKTDYASLGEQISEAP
jgi:hypothetical protein